MHKCSWYTLDPIPNSSFPLQEPQLPFDSSVIQKMRNFVINNGLKCPLATSLGIQHFWIDVISINTTREMPCVQLRTYDGHRVRFIVDDKVVKLTDLNLCHQMWDGSNGGIRKCFNCSYIISHIFKSTILPAFQLPESTLKDNQSLLMEFSSAHNNAP